MDAVDLAVMGLEFTAIAGAYSYTLFIQRDSAKERKALRDHVDNLDKAWTRTADDMRKARDTQIQELKGDTQTAISNLTVSHYDYKLYAAQNFATNRSVEQVEANLLAVFGKLESKFDRITDLIERKRGP